jgi:ABC-type polysaccharide/polyol phosphate export permease
MLNPLGMTIVLSIVFSQVFGRDESYAVYVLTGLIPWTFFSQTTNASMVGLVWGGGLLKRIYIPRTAFSVSAVGTGLVNYVLSLVPLFAIMLLLNVPLRSSLILIPIPILYFAMFSLGMGLLLSSVAVHFSDIREMYQIILTAWMYLSPIIFPIEIIPDQWLWLVRLNPMYYLISFFRAFIYEGRFPSLDEYLICGGIAFAMLLIGWLVFTRKADELAYRI